MQAATDAPCVGCGGRNAADARECLWCGRPSAGPAASGAPPPRWLVGGLAVVVLGGLAALLIGFPWPRNLDRAEPAPGAPTEAPASPSPAAPAPPAAAAAEEPPPSGAEEAPSPEFVRVVNTGGQGISLRREPGVGAARIVARAENAVLQVVGADELAEGRVWRHVQDAQGNRGWAPADFLAPASPPS